MTKWDHPIIPWSGGPCPLHPDTKIRYWLRNFNPKTDRGATLDAGKLRRDHRDAEGDIIAYQVVA